MRAQYQSYTYPLDAIPPDKLKAMLTQVQDRLYSALHAFNQGQEFFLGNDFDVVSTAAARAMMAKYPGLLQPVTIALQNWRQRDLGEILKALQMAAIAAHEHDTQRTAINVLRNMCKELGDLGVNDAESYRLLHHAHEAMAEATGEIDSTKAALSLAKRFFPYEAQHLQSYGWGLSSHVVALYEMAASRPTTRGEKLREYNHGMAAVVSQALEDLRRKGCALP